MLAKSNETVILFYSQRRGDPDFKGLSNFTISPFSETHPLDPAVAYVEYLTVEHYFNAHKTLDVQEFNHVVAASTPKEAKRRGRLVTLQADWDRKVRHEVMLAALRLKFAIPEFCELLLSTGDAVLMEDSPWDFVWGGRDVQGGYGGRNFLGRALMKVREEL